MGAYLREKRCGWADTGGGEASPRVCGGRPAARCRHCQPHRHSHAGQRCLPSWIGCRFGRMTCPPLHPLRERRDTCKVLVGIQRNVHDFCCQCRETIKILPRDVRETSHVSPAQTRLHVCPPLAVAECFPSSNGMFFSMNEVRYSMTSTGQHALCLSGCCHLPPW